MKELGNCIRISYESPEMISGKARFRVVLTMR
jgi:hypothetical protein